MSLLKRSLNNESGFTLLEVLIAVAIMVVALAAILMAESNSINAAARAQNDNIVTMLARNKMAETEAELEGKALEEVNDAAGGGFESPYENYRWETNIKEIKFPAINVSGGGEGMDQIAELLTRLFTNFLSKAVREVTVTIYWKRGSGEQKFTVSTYWVDLNHEFQLSE